MSKPLIVVAHNHRVGQYYANQFGEPNATIITTAEKLYGLSLGPDSPQIVVVDSDDADRFTPGITEQIIHLQRMGVEIDWLG